MSDRYKFYRVYFTYVDGNNKLRRDNVKLDALNPKDAKRRVIKGEKPKIIAVQKIKRV